MEKTSISLSGATEDVLRRVTSISRSGATEDVLRRVTFISWSGAKEHVLRRVTERSEYLLTNVIKTCLLASRQTHTDTEAVCGG